MQAPENLAISTKTLIRWTVEDYHRLIEKGILHNRQVELLAGEIVEMPPEGPEHSYKTASGAEYLRNCLAGKATIREAHPVTLTASEPQPDIAVVRGTHEDYRTRHPQPEEILLLIEISRSTLAYDLGDKKQTYAEAGIDEYWVMDISARELHVFRRPSAGIYTDSQVVNKGSLQLLMLPSVSVTVKTLLG